MELGDVTDPKRYGSTVRDNLMKRPGYAPYCMGMVRDDSERGFRETACTSRFRRMRWDGEQFACPCGSRTEFPEDFMELYKARWHTKGGE